MSGLQSVKVFRNGLKNARGSTPPPTTRRFHQKHMVHFFTDLRLHSGLVRLLPSYINFNDSLKPQSQRSKWAARGSSIELEIISQVSERRSQMARPKKVSQQVPIKDPKTGKLKGSRSTKGSAEKDIPKASTPTKKAVAKKVIVKKTIVKKVAAKTLPTKIVVLKKATVTRPGKSVAQKKTAPDPVPLIDIEPVKKGPRLFPSLNKLPEHGLSFDGFLTAVQKLDEATIELLIDTQTTLAPNKWKYARSVEAAQKILTDDEFDDDAALINYEEEWTEKYPRLSEGGGGEFNAIYDFRFNMSGVISLDKGYEIAARTCLALLARKEDINFADSQDYEVLTSAWRTHVGRIHRDDEDLLVK